MKPRMIISAVVGPRGESLQVVNPGQLLITFRSVSTGSPEDLREGEPAMTIVLQSLDLMGLLLVVVMYQAGVVKRYRHYWDSTFQSNVQDSARICCWVCQGRV